MPRRGRPYGALWWIGVAVAIVVLVLLLAALQWDYLPRDWRGFAWLAFVGVPVWLALEWVGGSVEEKAKDRSWAWRLVALSVMFGAVLLIVWLMPAAPR
jgi:hypothetical protein